MFRVKRWLFRVESWLALYHINIARKYHVSNLNIRDYLLNLKFSLSRRVRVLYCSTYSSTVVFEFEYEYIRVLEYACTPGNVLITIVAYWVLSMSTVQYSYSVVLRTVQCTFWLGLFQRSFWPFLLVVHLKEFLERYDCFRQEEWRSSTRGVLTGQYCTCVLSRTCIPYSYCFTMEGRWPQGHTTVHQCTLLGHSTHYSTVHQDSNNCTATSFIPLYYFLQHPPSNSKTYTTISQRHI
jgi:hypothetical protein